MFLSYFSSARKPGNVLLYILNSFPWNLKQCVLEVTVGVFPAGLLKCLSPLPFLTVAQFLSLCASDLEIHKDKVFCNDGSTTEYV